MFAQGFIVISFCIAASLQFTPFTPCNEGQAPSAVKVAGCTESPCKFVRGDDAVADVDFTAVVATDNLKPETIVTLGAVDIKYPLPEQDACKSLTKGSCPLAEADAATYGLRMPVLKSYPKLKLHLKLSLVDSNKNVHVCFEIDAVVVDK